jgi:N-acetylneuraminate synthase
MKTKGYHRPAFVAEVSSNHNCDLNRCLGLIDAAESIGCESVKFQLFRISELFAPEILESSEQHRRRKAWELPLRFLPQLSNYAHQKGILFACTPFYLEAVNHLLPYVDFYKIASYEILWSDLIAACAETGKPLVLSTGMATLEEIETAVSVFSTHGGQDLTLLHCVSGYPTPVQECNLSAIQTLRARFGCPVGWSDHSVSPAVLFRAIFKWEASLIEFHLDLDRTGAEFASGHCWLPGQIQEVIQTVRASITADGDGKKLPSPSEAADREWRTEPTDGLRPLTKIRSQWRNAECER